MTGDVGRDGGGGPWSRRLFLALATAAAGFLFGSVRAWSEARPDSSTVERARGRRGESLTPAECETLTAAALVFLDVPVDGARYRRLVEGLAARDPRARETLVALADRLEARARREEGGAFAEVAPEAKRRVLDRALGRSTTPGEAGGDTVSSRFTRAVASDFTDRILAVFARSDAWILLGYPQHPGRARGLVTYRGPVR